VSGVTQADAIDVAAAHLGVRIVRRFNASMFGAALVEGRGDEPLVLKASTDVALAPEWATGAAMAARLRALGYPAPTYRGTGTTEQVTWTLQTVLPGRVPQMFTADHAAQLVGLACRHDVDSGMRRPWDAQARAASRRALTELGPLPERFDETLGAVLRETEGVALAQTTVVHGDFHHRNFLVHDGRVTGVFDWDIAGPGDWRFDLVCLAFACQMYPKTCDAEALAIVIAAVREHCDAPTAAFLTACQTLRALSMLRARRPEWVEPASRRMRSTGAQWWDA
jgi:aminoglycoside phosphotransferase (APT) family kinase protein